MKSYDALFQTHVDFFAHCLYAAVKFSSLFIFTLCLTLTHLDSATLDFARPAACILLGCWVMRPAIYVLAYLAAWDAELIKKEPDPGYSHLSVGPDASYWNTFVLFGIHIDSLAY